MKRLVTYLMLAGVLVLLGGCQGFLADRKIGSIDAIMAQLNPLSPEVHAPQEWQSLQQQVAAVKSTRASDASGANQQATAILATAEQLLERVRREEANTRYGSARQAVDIMTMNDARLLNPTKFDQVQTVFREADEARIAGDFVRTLDRSRNVIIDVEQLLVPLRQEAEVELRQLQSERAQMDRYECPLYAPEMVAEVEQFIRSVSNDINTTRNYRQAIQSAREGKRTAQEGITKSNRTRAMLQITQLEERLAKAVDEGAEIYAASQFNAAAATFESVVQRFLEDDYERVLSTLQILRPQVDQLIFITLSKSTEDKLTQLSRLIERHREGRVETYLRGRLERLEERVQGIRADFSVTARSPEQFPTLPDSEKRSIEESFENIKTQIQESFILSERIDAAFDELAGSNIRDAEFQLNIARDLFTRMADAFMKPTPADVTPLDADFTRSKATRQAELGRQIANSDELLRQARNDRSSARFYVAVETANRVSRTAEFVQGQIYRVVGDNAILELENQISRFTGEGAEEYATDDLNRTRSLLNDTKQLMLEEKFREAVEAASRVRAQLDVTIQVLSRATLARIERAQQAVVAAEELRANQFAPETVSRARSFIQQAEQALLNRSYRSSMQFADMGLQTANEASQEAGLAWSRSEIEKARAAQEIADAAQAVGYAPLQMRQAQNQFFTARELRERGLYLASANSAMEAAASFNSATYLLINNANEAIMTARRSEGWKYESDELTKAIVRVDEARQLLEGGSYLESRHRAEESRRLAEEVTAAAQRAGVQERLARIQRSLGTAERSGANYFQVSEVKRLLGETERVKATAATRTYEDLIEELNRIEAEFEIVISSTSERISGIVAAQRAKLDALESNPRVREISPEGIRDARNYLNFVEIDYAGRNYARAYTNLRNALTEVERIETGLAEQAYQIRVTTLFRELSDTMADFQAVLSISPDAMERLSLNVQGRGQALAVANAMPPTQFKQRIDDIYIRMLAVEVPPTREHIHRQVLQTMVEARSAATEFQKFLIFDELDPRTIRQTIRSAYGHMDRMQTLRANVQQRLVNAGADLDVVPLRRSRNEGMLLQAALNAD